MTDATPTMPATAPSASKRRQQTGRSPAYPSISLPKAVQRVGELFQKERQFEVAATTVPNLWGYQNLNGPAGLALSALKKFGLVDDEGTKDARTVRVTDLAVQILNHPSSDARAVAIKEAALMPPIHQEMWEEFGTRLPSDANLMWRLTRSRGFTETGAKEFIREWRETMEFARLTTEDASAAHVTDSLGITDEVIAELVPGPEPEVPLDNEQRIRGALEQNLVAPKESGTMVVTSPQVQNYPIPIALRGRPPVIISGPFPLSEAEWLQFKAVLNAMKPVLVGDPAPEVLQDAPELSE